MNDSHQHARPSVLLVDDVEANLVALEAQLAELDCDLVRASTGNEALRQLLKRDFAMMLLDVQMPGMDGLEVASLARENPATREVPIIFVTAMMGTEDNLLRAYGSGAVDFLHKPINPSILRSKVRVFVDLHVSRKRLADEIDAHKATLADLEAYTYSVSHDLRAPLRHLDGFSAALMEDFGETLEGRAKDYLVRIRSGAQRMSLLIEDFLRLSRIRSAGVRRTSVNLSSTVLSVIAELREADPAREVESVVGEDMRAHADDGLVRIALENLLRNSWKFTRNTAHARIEIGRTFEQGKEVYFVRDNGVGFDAEHAELMFRPFQRFHAQAEYEGTGIGLAIVERVIRHHGGRIWAESKPGLGATFFFTLG